MRIFTCSACQQLLFFENVQCTSCGRALGFLPEHGLISALEPHDIDANGAVTTATRFVALAPAAKSALYRRCQNGLDHAACSWLVRDEDEDALCCACRLNAVIPDLEQPDALSAWQKLERAKRRLLYTLMQLDLPIESRLERPEHGLAFAFMSDGDDGEDKVFTGHAAGLITINIAEADDPFREQIRKDMGEAYRTLLGHFRHEVGHYYWDRLIRDTRWLERFRALFGDERSNYAEATKRHYEHGAPPDWMLNFVSAYATMHPWEDWAETWAHYLHMVDTLDTARAYGVILNPKLEGGSTALLFAARKLNPEHFDDLIAGWVPVTLALNGMNRSMGLADPYPFVLSEHAFTKLRFVHDVVAHWNVEPSALTPVLERWPEAEPTTVGPVTEEAESIVEEAEATEATPDAATAAALTSTADRDRPTPDDAGDGYSSSSSSAASLSSLSSRRLAARLR